MFIPKTPCSIAKIGNYDLYGREVEGQVYSELCAVVRLQAERQHTTVRTDSSASRGHADEPVANVKILLTPETVAALGDKLTVEGISVRITSVFPRRSVMGVLEHYEVKGEMWPSA